MLNAARHIACKDLRLMTGRGAHLARPLLLGLLLVTLFALAAEESPAPFMPAAVFWLSSIFCLVILMTALFDLEEGTGARTGLLLAPVPVQAVWLGKGLAGLILLLGIQLALFAASLILFNPPLTGGLGLTLAGILLPDIGIVALAALLASLTGGQSARESLASLVIFPLLLPQLLAGIRLLGSALGGTALAGETARWLGLAAAFDAIFVAAALVLFPFLYGDDA